MYCLYAELLAIEKALGLAQEQTWQKDILILSDCKSAINDIDNNKLEIHKHEYVNKIRNRIDQYEKG